MSFMCAICLEMLTNKPPGQAEEIAEIDIIATKCGHVFHQNCLQKWFLEQKSPFMQCPNCARPVVEAENRKLWLNQDEDTDDLNAKVNEIKRKSKTIETLELDNVTLKTCAEEEGMLVDIIRYEYEGLEKIKNIEITKLATELKDKTEEFAVQEESYKEAMKTSEQTINDLKRHLEEYKNRENALSNGIKFWQSSCSVVTTKNAELQTKVDLLMQLQSMGNPNPSSKFYNQPNRKVGLTTSLNYSNCDMTHCGSCTIAVSSPSAANECQIQNADFQPHTIVPLCSGSIKSEFKEIQLQEVAKQKCETKIVTEGVFSVRESGTVTNSNIDLQPKTDSDSDNHSNQDTDTNIAKLHPASTDWRHCNCEVISKENHSPSPRGQNGHGDSPAISRAKELSATVEMIENLDLESDELEDNSQLQLQPQSDEEGPLDLSCTSGSGTRSAVHESITSNERIDDGFVVM